MYVVVNMSSENLLNENLESDSLGWWLPDWFIKEFTDEVNQEGKPSFEEFKKQLEERK